jgi:hypothetical protein
LYVVLCYYIKQRLFSLYTIKRLILITEKECVYGAVRSESLSVIQVYHILVFRCFGNAISRFIYLVEVKDRAVTGDYLHTDEISCSLKSGRFLAGKDY